MTTKRQPIQTDTAVSPWFPYDEPFTVCPACSGQLEPLGQLGAMAHYRCRHCGIDCTAKIN